jgi:uncharacterized protein
MISDIVQWLGVSVGNLALIWLVVFIAAFIRGLTGFGLAIILIPLLSIIILPERAVLLGILIGLLNGYIGYRASWRRSDPAVMRPIILSAMIAAPIGLLLLTQTPPDIARLLIALISIAGFAVLSLHRTALPPPGAAPLVATGLASGFLGGFAAIPGPPVLYYFVRTGITPTVARDAMIVIFFWSPWTTAIAALLTGRLDWNLAALALLCFPLLFTGNMLGRRYFGRLPEKTWRALVLILIGLSAIGALLKFILQA